MLIRGIKYFMILSGTWDIAWTEDPFVKTIQLWYRRGNQGIMLIFILLMFGKLIQLILISADADVTYACTSIFLTSSGFGLKVFIYQNNNVSRLFREIIDEEKRIITSLEGDVIKYYNAKVKVFIKLKNGIIITILFAALLFFLFKASSIKPEAGQKSEKEMLQESFIYPIWLPFKERDNAIYALIINLVLMFVAINMFLTDQIITYGLMAFTNIELKIMHNFIRNLQTSGGKDINHYTALRKIAKNHQFLISFIKKLNHYMKYVILTNFCLNSINLASITIVLLMQDTLSKVAYPVMNFAILVINIFLQGWFANEINVQSLAIGDLLYQTNWYNYDIRSRKLLPIMLAQAQQPRTLSIGSFGPMTLATALRSVQAAYSYITLMRNMK